MKRFIKIGDCFVHDKKTQMHYAMSIRIVNKVVRLLNKDAERCEWKESRNFYNFDHYSTSCQGHKLNAHEYYYDKDYYKLCPQCGRKIKVVK